MDDAFYDTEFEGYDDSDSENIFIQNQYININLTVPGYNFEGLFVAESDTEELNEEIDEEATNRSYSDDSMSIISTDYSVGSTEINLSDALSDSSINMSESDVEVNSDIDIEHEYNIRSRRHDGNVAPIPPSRISNQISNSDTDMEMGSEIDINSDQESLPEDNDDVIEISPSNSPSRVEEDVALPSAVSVSSVIVLSDTEMDGDIVLSNALEQVGNEQRELNTESQSNSAADARPSSQRTIIEIENSDPPKSPDKNKEKCITPKAKKRVSDADEIDDGMTCSVCLDSFTNSGAHRLVSLRCGHLFGNSCIERWLKSGCMGGVRRCPTCNKRANLRDIRVIYARRLLAVDTSEKDRIQKELDKVKDEKSRLALEVSKIKLKFDVQETYIKSLQKQIELLESLSDNNESKNSNKKCTGINLRLISTIDLSKNGYCRILEYSKNGGLLIASQKSSVSLFPGYGIRKIDVLDFKPSTFVNLHSSPIRDLEFHFDDRNLLLSVSLDKTAKLFDNVSNSVVQTFKDTNLLWSCCWDLTNPHRFMTGSQNGIVKIYDKRQTSEPLVITSPGDTTPVVSLCSVPPTQNSVFSLGGFLSCRLNAVYAYQERSLENGNLVCIDGPFISLNYNPTTQLVLASTRPSSRFPNTRHTLSQLGAAGDERFCNTIHSFTCGNSGQLMSRTCQILMPDDDVWVAAHDESKKSVELLSVNNNAAVHKFPVPEPILDLCPIKVNDSCFLSSLSANKLSIHGLY